MIGAPGSTIVFRSALACFVAMGGSGLALADGSAEAARVSFDVQVVHGSNKGEAKSDPRCEQIKHNLPIQFKSLSEVQRKRLKSRLGQPSALKLPSGRQIRLVPISIIDNRLHVLLKMEGLVESQLRLSSGRAVIVGGEPYDDGRIIIKLTPQFKSPPAIAVTPAIRHGLQPAPSGLPDVESIGHPSPR